MSTRITKVFLSLVFVLSLLFLSSLFSRPALADYRDVTTYGTATLPVGDARYVNSYNTTTPTAIFQLNNNCGNPSASIATISNGAGVPAQQGWILLDLGSYVNTNQIKLQIKNSSLNNKIYSSNSSGAELQLLGSITGLFNGCYEYTLNMSTSATVRYLKIKNTASIGSSTVTTKLVSVIVRETYTPFTLSNFAVLDSQNSNPIKIVPEGYTNPQSNLSDAGCGRYPANTGDSVDPDLESSRQYILDLGQKTKASGIYLDVADNGPDYDGELQVLGSNRLGELWTILDVIATKHSAGCQSITRALSNQNYRFIWLRNLSSNSINMYRVRLQYHPTFPSRGLAQLYWGTGHENDRTLLNVDWWYAWSQDGTSGAGPRAVGNGRINMDPDWNTPTACYDYLLLGNEPSDASGFQHYMPADQAVTKYIQISNLCPNMKIVVGNLFWGSANEQTWLNDFRNIFAQTTGVPFTGTVGYHFYPLSYGDDLYATTQVNSAFDTYPNAWVTEFNNMYGGFPPGWPVGSDPEVLLDGKFTVIMNAIRARTNKYAAYTNRSDGSIYFLPYTNLINALGQLNNKGTYYSTH